MSKLPDADLVEQFRQLEEKVDSVLGLVRQLKEENARLQKKLAETARQQQDAVRRIDAVLDRIDSLT